MLEDSTLLLRVDRKLAIDPTLASSGEFKEVGGGGGGVGDNIANHNHSQIKVGVTRLW